MRIFYTYLLIIFAFSSCQEKKMRDVVEVLDRHGEYELTTPTGSVIGDVNFSKKGAEFLDNTTVSYILFDSIKLNKSSQKNISMWFKFEGEDARIPQMLFSIKDTIDIQKRFNMWIAGRRITALLNGNHLWANQYDYSKGRSKTYYDSFLLEPGKYYFLSVNYTPEKVEIYINAELYQQFDTIKEGNINFDQIYIGTERHYNEFRNPFIGNIRNLTLFDRQLSENEIYSLSVEAYEAIYEFNKAYELSKFNFEKQ